MMSCNRFFIFALLVTSFSGLCVQAEDIHLPRIEGSGYNASLGIVEPTLGQTQKSVLPAVNENFGWEILSNPQKYNLSPFLANFTNSIAEHIDFEGVSEFELTLFNGEVKDTKVIKSSGSKIVDDTLINAINNTPTQKDLLPPNSGEIKIKLICQKLKQYSEIGDNPSEVDFAPYMRELQRRIKSNWHPPVNYDSKRVSVFMKIDKAGNLLACSIYQSSGYKNADKSVLDAVYETAPFRPLPEEYNGKTVDIIFTFDYYVFSNKQQRPVVNFVK